MIYIGPHAFEIFEGKNKILKFREIGKMGPYAHGEFSPAIFSAYRDIVQDTILNVTKKIFNEGYFMKNSNLMALESLAKQYEFTSLIAWFKRYWEDMDQQAITNNLYAEAKNRPEKEHEIGKVVKDFKDEIALSDDGPAMTAARISYLQEQTANLSSHVEELESEFQAMEDRDCEGWLIELRKHFTNYEKLAGKVRSNRITIGHLQGKYADTGKKVVTDDMIAAAKKVPFNKLIKLEVVGGRAKALCPFHNEKTPSFVVYGDTNRGHCHGCGKNVDTIQFLVEHKKLEFNQAVLTLLDY